MVKLLVLKWWVAVDLTCPRWSNRTSPEIWQISSLRSPEYFCPVVLQSQPKRTEMLKKPTKSWCSKARLVFLICLWTLKVFLSNLLELRDFWWVLTSPPISRVFDSNKKCHDEYKGLANSLESPALQRSCAAVIRGHLILIHPILTFWRSWKLRKRQMQSTRQRRPDVAGFDTVSIATCWLLHSHENGKPKLEGLVIFCITCLRRPMWSVVQLSSGRVP